jgi:DnaA family protein
LGLALPDLVSRMTSGATFRVHTLPDSDKLQALRHRARWRGVELPEATARYLMQRVDRDTGSLFALLAELDRQSIVAQKRLTVPFVRRVLDGLSDAG